ncbi:MAG: nitroreductase family protein, partial [Tidjanibacter sp.]|nr:nitroreductase family protein [Tidjanibacter sp.]
GMTLINVGLMGENMCLAAQELGLGTCIMAGPSAFLVNSPKAKPYLDRLGFSEGYKLRYVLGVGYPAESPAAKPRNLSKIKFVE